MDKERIAAYLRISVDDDPTNDNVSIENQRKIISDYVKTNFPGASLEFYTDRDLSGYTFITRPAYQEMKAALLNGTHNILMVKDFSRFGRRNSLGLLELENFRDQGIRVVSIGDGVDYPTNNDWLMIQFRFLMNEIPVTETSKKIKDVIRRRQKDGEWICAVPYGYYLHPAQKNKIEIDPEGAEIVREIFGLYNAGWGYKKIANYLTDKGSPTPTELLKKRLQKNGAETGKIENRIPRAWSHVTIARIVKNDFYIGTLRQNTWSREGINKKDRRTPEKSHVVFKNHHDSIIDEKTFETAAEHQYRRSVTHYKGVRKYPIPYSGTLFCAQCGSPMFSISQPKRPPAYVCGTYHRRGLRGCTSHHIRESVIDDAVRAYISRVRQSLGDNLFSLDENALDRNRASAKEQLSVMEKSITDVKISLRESTKQRLRKIAQNPDAEDTINEIFDMAERDLLSELKSFEKRKAALTREQAKTKELKNDINKALDIFNSLLAKKKFAKEDISLIVDRITVDADKTLTIELKSSIAELFSEFL